LCFDITPFTPPIMFTNCFEFFGTINKYEDFARHYLLPLKGRFAVE
jgi:hypothetical protein